MEPAVDNVFCLKIPFGFSQEAIKMIKTTKESGVVDF